MKKYIEKLGIKDWSNVIGWLIFLILLISAGTDNYIFNPFLFGFAYYVINTLRKHFKSEKQKGTNEQLILVSIIALFYMWGSLKNQSEIKSYVRDVNKMCHPRSLQISNEVSGFDIETASQLCEEINSHIENRFYPETDDNDL